MVAGIWEADDVFTAALMRRFYGNLRLGHDKAEALTMAERELLKMYGANAARGHSLKPPIRNGAEIL